MAEKKIGHQPKSAFLGRWRIPFEEALDCGLSP